MLKKKDQSLKSSGVGGFKIIGLCIFFNCITIIKITVSFFKVFQNNLIWFEYFNLIG
jgi:hypothetical protein